jgi:purine-binding chemotaxis protein CheW
MSTDEPVRLAEARAPAPEHVAELRRRARALAREGGWWQAAAADDSFSALVFQLAGSTYAVDAACVLRVLTLRELTPLPGAAAPLFGVTHWRGDVLTLLDIRPLLGASTGGLTDMGRVIVMDGEDRHFGLVVDAVTELADVRRESIQRLPREDGDGESLLEGITEAGVFIIDAARVLARFGVIRRNQGTG